MLKVDFRPAPHILRQFAYIAIVGVPLVALLILKLCGVFAWSHPAMLAAAGVGLVQALLFMLGVKIVTHVVYVVLMVVAMPIGFVLSHVLIAAIYYLVITPIGLIFRLVGRDAIGRKLDPKAASYWVVRGAVRAKASYFKLY